MDGSILEKIRRLNWVLSETTTGSLSYKDLSGILCELVDANVLLFDTEGRVLGSAYRNIEDKSTIGTSGDGESIVAGDNARFLAITQSMPNLYGADMRRLLGEDYAMAEKYHTILPVVCGGKRLGTLLLTRRDVRFADEEVALGEYGATVVGLEIQRELALQEAAAQRQRLAVEMAVSALSYSERTAIGHILEELTETDGEEGGETGGRAGIIVASKIAGRYQLTNSVIVNALRKLESAGLLATKSLGMKGTRIEILNPYLTAEAVQ